jgi:hypothetical protein
MSDQEKLKQLCALLFAHSVLRTERINSHDGKLSNSLDGDIDTLADTIFEIYREECARFGLSDFDMSLSNYLKEQNCFIENLHLLGWAKT